MRGRIMCCIQSILIADQDQPKHRVMHPFKKIQWKIKRYSTINTFNSVINFKKSGFLNIFNCALSWKNVGSWIEKKKSCTLRVVGELELTNF